MKCQYCNKEIQEDSVFCEYCGRRMLQTNSNPISQSKTIVEKEKAAFAWYKKCFKQYTDFKTRARRKEYWFFTLFNVMFSFVAMLLDKEIFYATGLLNIIYTVAVIIPSLAVSVRRLHDINKSGWYILLNLIPFIGVIILIYWFCQDSEPQTNEWGECPKYV